MLHRLGDFKALTFDCYGTLIDWETGIWDALQPLLMHNGCESVNRATALEAFATLESRQEAETPAMLYPELLSHVHRGLSEHFGLNTTNELNQAFGASVPSRR